MGIVEDYKKMSEQTVKALGDRMQEAAYNDAYDIWRSGCKEMSSDARMALRKYIEDNGITDLRNNAAFKKDARQLLNECAKDSKHMESIYQIKSNEANGIKLAPLESTGTDGRTVETALNSMMRSEAVSDDLIDQILDRFNMLQFDRQLRYNADQASAAGYEEWVVRTYKGDHEHTQRSASGGNPWKKECRWCKRMAGKYNYLDVKRDGHEVWRRHDGCDCQIDFVSNGNVDPVINYKHAKASQKKR